VDTILSSAQYCGLITDYVFIKTPLGIAAFIAGFLLSLWSCARSANFNKFFIFAFLSLSVLSLIIVPRRQEDRAPVLFVFVSDMADAVFKGALLLEKPFAPHRLSLHMRIFIRQGVQDHALKYRLAEFLHAHYLPVLGMTGLRVWPGDPQVISHYSSQAKTEWEGLRRDLLNTLNASASPWPAAREYLSQWAKVPDRDLDSQALQSLVQREILPPLQGDPFWQACGWVFAVFPSIYAVADASLGIVFPFTLLALLIACNLSFLTGYVRNFIWIKSWLLGGALCHFASLALVPPTAGSPVLWFWEYPTYAAFGALLLCCMPLMTFFLTRLPMERRMT